MSETKKVWSRMSDREIVQVDDGNGSPAAEVTTEEENPSQDSKSLSWSVARATRSNLQCGYIPHGGRYIKVCQQG
jgi:hypothetical protein